jgi:S-methylmethionine-dependent homocysteine/selenocysteine methylase
LFSFGMYSEPSKLKPKPGNIGFSMSKYRNELPQLSGDLFLTDAGLETDLIFNHGIEIREFAAHTLLPDPLGREALANYLRGFLSLANEHDAGFVLDSQTWKAHSHWAEDLAETEQELRQANEDAIVFIAKLRDEFSGNSKPIVLNGNIGPRGDAYAPETRLAAREAEKYHANQIGWLAETEIDMVTALTFTQSDEAIGVVRAAQSAGLPVVVSFTVETDGSLPTGQPLNEAIDAVDDATEAAAAYYMVNCAHPDHFFDVLNDSAWAHRIRGLRCNASRLSHAELDECEVLDDGDPVELANQYRAIATTMPWLNVFGGCCGSDLRHVAKIATAVRG